MGLKKVILPILGIDMESAVVERWLKAEGDHVSRDEPIVLVETDKASTEIVSPFDGILRTILHGPGDEVAVTAALAVLDVEGPGDTDDGQGAPPAGSQQTASAGSPAQPAPREEVATRSDAGPVRASPAARRIARGLGIELPSISGSGPGGRIQGEDVRAFASRSAPGAHHPVSEASRAPTLPGRLVPLGKKRRITAERMSLSARTVARLTMNLEVDATEMVGFRTRLLETFQREHGVRLSYNDFIVKAVAVALKEHPYLNARWRDDGILLVESVNVGVAVAVEDGLVVPVIKQADRKGLADISSELAGLVDRARADHLSAADLSGGTFTITSLGMYGIDSFTPIVNPPEAAILGIGRIAEKPVGRDGNIVLRSVMTLSLSFDHRIVDGAPAARFLQRVQHLLEEPSHLL